MLLSGAEQARALQAADVTVIANAGNAGGGRGQVMDLFTSKGGTHLAASVEAFAQSPLGRALVGKPVPVERPAAAVGRSVVLAEAAANSEAAPGKG